MTGKTKMMSQVKQLLRMHGQGVGIRTIAKRLGISRNTVKSYLTKVGICNKSLDELLAMDDPELERFFFAGHLSHKERDRYSVIVKLLPNYAKELTKTGVTRQLLWEEYIEAYPTGYSHTQFCYHLQQYLKNSKPSMVLTHKPAERLFVDFAGKKLSCIDPDTGEVTPYQVFVACLPYSDYSFAIAVPSQKSVDFIHCLQECLAHLEGVPKTIVTDNLKAAVTKHDRYEPDINKVLADFANHYGTTVTPTRTYKPQDKALVENAVKLVYTRVFAKIRNQKFFDLHTLNEAIKEKVLLHNQTRMQRKTYCREELFLSKEKPLLSALPEKVFEIKSYKKLKVAKNNHIYLSSDKHHYSVPYQYIGKKTNVTFTPSLVKVYVDNKQVAVHQRAKEQGYTTKRDHLCSTHQHYLDRSPDYYQKRASQYSKVFSSYVAQLFKTRNQPPEQLYRSCDGLIKLSKQTEQETFDKACRIAMDYGQYTYKFILNLISNKMVDNKPVNAEKPLPNHSNIRDKSEFC